MIDRVSDADRALIARMEAEVLAAQRLRDFVWAHVAAVYDLKLGPGGDRIEDGGSIVRAASG